jgi:hypothetical protein
MAGGSSTIVTIEGRATLGSSPLQHLFKVPNHDDAGLNRSAETRF